MIIEHVALWTKDIENAKMFFTKYFGGKAGEKYINSETNFESYFIYYDNGARLELMQIPGISKKADEAELFFGYSHVAFSTGSKERVDKLTEELRSNNYKILREPRFTGDGYYESCIMDADNNRIEITI